MGRVIAVVAGIVAIVFILVELTGSGSDEHIAQTLYTAGLMLLLTIAGSAGLGLAHRRPRLALLGLTTAAISLLAFGGLVASIWSGGFGFGFGGSFTGVLVAEATLVLALATSMISVLLSTEREEDDGPTRLLRGAAVGAIALIAILALLSIADSSIRISGRVFAIFATVFVVATAALFVLRLLVPVPGEVDEIDAPGVS